MKTLLNTTSLLMISMVIYISGFGQPSNVAIEQQIMNELMPPQLKVSNILMDSDFPYEAEEIRNSRLTNTRIDDTDFWQFDTVTCYNLQGIYYRLIQQFDEKGNILVHLRQQWQINGWDNSMRLTFQYDENNNRISQIYENWDNDTWKNFSRNSFSFDQDNNLISMLYEIWQFDQWNHNLLYSYSYDEAGNILEYLRQGWENNSWQHVSKTSFTYNQDNQKIS
ncbi:MAG: hypothetical protein M0P54_12140, partial [Bacteroidales bacterium]|nr:hypothetical protein [Bacteroidales bacterium]